MAVFDGYNKIINTLDDANYFELYFKQMISSIL
jgi:hypothetical protein